MCRRLLTDGRGHVVVSLFRGFLRREQHGLHAVGFGGVPRRFLSEREARDHSRTHPLEPRVLEQHEHLSLRESAADSAGPELGVVDDGLRKLYRAHDVGDRKPAAGLEDAARLTVRLRNDRLMTPFEMTTSTVASGSGMSSIRPSWHAIRIPEAAACASALRHIVGLRSTPITRPVGPTCHAAMMLSSPAPLPRSSTVSPGWSRLRRCGLPTPANDATAPEGARSSQSRS